MSKADHLMSDADLSRRVLSRRDGPDYGPRRCRHCRVLFVPRRHCPHARFCCKQHRQNHWQYAREKLKSLIKQARRAEQARPACPDCGRPLPPPGKTGPLRSRCDACKVRLCRAKARSA